MLRREERLGWGRPAGWSVRVGKLKACSWCKGVQPPTLIHGGPRLLCLQAGGECLTFDELALRAPKGTNCVLLRGPKDREALRYDHVQDHMAQGVGGSGPVGVLRAWNPALPRLDCLSPGEGEAGRVGMVWGWVDSQP